MPKTLDDFQLESGLKDDFDGTITADTYFGAPRKEYADKAAVSGGTLDPVLQLVILPDGDGEEPITQQYSLGPGKQWQVVKDGREIVSAKSPDSHRFNMSSRGGELVSKMFELAGSGDKVKGQEFFIKRDAYMTEVGFYAGLRYHFKVEKKPTVGGEPSNVLLPNKFLGEGKAVTTGKTESKSTGGDTSALNQLLIDNAGGKTDKELKQWALKNDVLKANSAYMKDVISGKKLKEMEDAGQMFKDSDGKYVSL